ncbi:MAG: AMP-binding protein, partial [Pseudomonadota bacterium]|nr:AMP-binding protein [Pseudomonadota bacterium]
MAEESIYMKKPWLKSYETGVPTTLTYEDICLPDILDRTAREFAERPALVFQGTTINFRELKDMVDRFATCLTAFGIKKGDAVALLLPNIVPCVAAYFAILKIGALAV